MGKALSATLRYISSKRKHKARTWAVLSCALRNFDTDTIFMAEVSCCVERADSKRILSSFKPAILFYSTVEGARFSIEMAAVFLSTSSIPASISPAAIRASTSGWSLLSKRR